MIETPMETQSPSTSANLNGNEEKQFATPAPPASPFTKLKRSLKDRNYGETESNTSFYDSDDSSRSTKKKKPKKIKAPNVTKNELIDKLNICISKIGDLKNVCSNQAKFIDNLNKKVTELESVDQANSIAIKGLETTIS